MTDASSHVSRATSAGAATPAPAAAAAGAKPQSGGTLPALEGVPSVLPPAGITPELAKRIAEQRERERTVAAMRQRKKKEADEASFAAIIEDCREHLNRRKVVVALERVLQDEENELNEESPLVIKVKARGSCEGRA